MAPSPNHGFSTRHQCKVSVQSHIPPSPLPLGISARHPSYPTRAFPPQKRHGISTRHFYKSLLQGISTRHFHKTFPQGMSTRHFYKAFLQSHPRCPTCPHSHMASVKDLCWSSVCGALAPCSCSNTGSGFDKLAFFAVWCTSLYSAEKPLPHT